MKQYIIGGFIILISYHLVCEQNLPPASRRNPFEKSCSATTAKTSATQQNNLQYEQLITCTSTTALFSNAEGNVRVVQIVEPKSEYR